MRFIFSLQYALPKLKAFGCNKYYLLMESVLFMILGHNGFYAIWNNCNIIIQIVVCYRIMVHTLYYNSAYLLNIMSISCVKIEYAFLLT